MQATMNLIENIFKTLPTGYYLGRPITIHFDAVSTTSYYDPAKDWINISGPMILEALKNLDVDEDTMEQLVRGVVYHELSHVILTPATLMSYASDRDIMNIFEDERIETLCSGVYMNTDFRNTVKVINKYTGPTLPQDAKQAFYSAVRFHDCTPKILTKIMNIIKEYASMANTKEDYDLRWTMKQYNDDIMDLYKEIAKDFQDMMDMLSQMSSDGDSEGDGEGQNTMSNTKSSSSNEKSDSNQQQTTSSSSSNDSSNEEESEGNEEQSNSSSSNDDSSEEKSNDQQSNAGSSNDEEESKDQQSGSSSNEENDSEEEKNSEEQNDSLDQNAHGSDEGSSKDTSSKNNSSEDEKSEEEKEQEALKEKVEGMIKDMSMTKDEFVQASNKVINKYYDPKLESKLAEIISRKMKRQALNGAALQGYSGTLDVRSIGERDDYRWWVQRNRAGHIKQFSKLHLNLFVDNSGSFEDNDDRMNTFIRALNRIQDPDFSFDVITINTEVKEWTNTDQIFKSSGCNSLSDNIAQVIQRHQKPGTSTYNIVVFDGDCHSDDYYRQDPEPLRWFDTSNTILITDGHNEKYIDAAKFSQAKVKIITRNYCSIFIEEILELLDRVS